MFDVIFSKNCHCVYALAAITGALSTWYFNISFMMFYKAFSISQFFADNYVNSVQRLLEMFCGFVYLLSFFCRTLKQSE